MACNYWWYFFSNSSFLLFEDCLFDVFWNVIHRPLNGKMPTSHWIILSGSALLMLIGIINLYGLEGPSFLASQKSFKLVETWPKNFKLIKYNELDSTNSEAKRLAFKDEINTCVFSRIQTNGKGSRGRKWISGSKNLTASFLFIQVEILLSFLIELLLLV